MSPQIPETVAVVEATVFKSQNARRMYDYIVAKRGTRARPTLTDIDLMELMDIAPSLCIRDVVADGADLKCRYWGTEFANAYQIDCTGKQVSETYSPQGVQNTLALHHRALAAEVPLRLVGNLGYVYADRKHVDFEGIMACVDGKDGPRQHIVAVGQFDYVMDDEDRAFLQRQTGATF